MFALKKTPSCVTQDGVFCKKESRAMKWPGSTGFLRAKPLSGEDARRGSASPCPPEAPRNRYFPITLAAMPAASSL